MFDNRMKKMPVLISYPRTGSHFLNGIVGLYSKRPRLRELAVQWTKSNKNFLYFHDHDLELEIDYKKLGHHKILYLYRKSEIDTIFSYFQYHLRTENRFKLFILFKSFYFSKKSKEFVKNILFDYRKHKNTYFSFLKDDQIVCYEKFCDDNQKYNEFKKVCKVFDIKYNKTKFDKVLLNVTKKSSLQKIKP